MTDLTDDERDAHERERSERLAAENRPANSEVDNSGATLPTVEKFAEMNRGEDVDGSAGTSDPSAAFRAMEVSEEERAEIEAERERRLAPENRPANAEVDNTGRKMVDGQFVD